MTPTPQNSDAEILRLIKEGKCFNCKGKRHTILNCSEKAKIFTITNASYIDDIENID